MTKRLVALFIAGLVIGVLAPSAASAADIDSTVSIALRAGADGQADGFTAQVASPSPYTENSCQRNRKVILQRQNQSGDFVDDPNASPAHTNPGGDAAIDVAPVPNARYRMHVDGKPLPNGNFCTPVNSAGTNASPIDTLTLNTASFGSFYGRVVLNPPAKAGCKPGRTIVLEEKPPGGDSFQPFATVTTDDKGDWAVRKARTNGARYRATAVAEQIDPSACLGGVSDVISP